MAHQPLVSIIMATYNHEDVIGKAIESVRNQEYQNWELLIVDDQSTDNTKMVIEAFAKTEPRIRLFCELHRGIWKLHDTYNVALKNSRGDLVAILEGDDCWPTNKLAKQVPWHLNYDDLILSYGRVGILDDHDQNSGPQQPSFSGLVSTSDFLECLLARKALMIPVSVVINAKTLREIGGFQFFRGYPATDFPTFLKLVLCQGTIYRSNEVLGYYRQHENQVTKNFGVELVEGALNLKLQLWADLPQDVKERMNITKEDIIRIDTKLLSDAYLGILRHILIQRDRKQIWPNAKKLWSSGGPKRKLQALYSLSAGVLGFDMEGILTFVRKR